MTKKYPVDLWIADRRLEDIMITDYPEKMIPWSEDLTPEDILESDFVYCEVDTSSDDKMYYFYNLEKDILLKFLEPYRQTYEYDMRDAKTGDFIVTNKPKLKRKYAEPNVLTFGASMN